MGLSRPLQADCDGKFCAGFQRSHKEMHMCQPWKSIICIPAANCFENVIPQRVHARAN